MSRRGEIDAAYFDKLPQRCKELFFSYLDESSFGKLNKGAALFLHVIGIYVNTECKSPIEQILDFALNIVLFERHKEDDPYFDFEYQKHIKVNDKNYYADIYFDSDFPDCNSDYKGKNHLKLVIECDGHNFHEKTKEQVIRNNERDYDLQLAGYKVLHFSGSQIYESPLSCANDIYNFIQTTVGEWIDGGIEGNGE